MQVESFKKSLAAADGKAKAKAQAKEEPKGTAAAAAAPAGAPAKANPSLKAAGAAVMAANNTTTKKKSKKERLSRRFRRLLRTKADGTEYDVAMFRPEEGLVMKESDWPFFHADLSEHSDSSDDERVSSFALFC